MLHSISLEKTNWCNKLQFNSTIASTFCIYRQKTSHNMCHPNVPHQVRAQKSYLNAFLSSPLLSAELQYSSNVMENKDTVNTFTRLSTHHCMSTKHRYLSSSKIDLQTPVEWPRHPLACHHGEQWIRFKTWFALENNDYISHWIHSLKYEDNTLKKR